MNNSGATISDALEYLDTLRHRFAKQRRKYDEFLEVMIEFKAQRISSSRVIERVKEILKGQDDLLVGFNTLLPRELEIALPPLNEPLAFREACQFVEKVKMQASDIYQSFLDILKEYRKEKVALNQVYQQVADLFHSHPDLLLEFTRFLPDWFDIPSANATPEVNHLDLQQEESNSSC